VDFIHLHTHQQYSLLDGLFKSSEWAKRAKELSMSALGISDHGNMHGAFSFSKACREQGVKPILGCELYSYKHRQERGKEHAFKYHHVLAICMNKKGYKNLCKLVSDAWTNGFYYRPQTDHKALKKYRKGLIITSACVGGEIGKAIMAGKHKKATKLIKWYKKTFDNFFLEIQPHDFESQIEVNHFLIRASQKYDIPLVTTNDSHYLLREHAFVHQVLLFVNSKATLADLENAEGGKEEGKKLFTFPSDTFDMPSGNDVWARYKSHSYFKKEKEHIEKSIKNTLKIAELCNYKIPSKIELPKFKSKAKTSLGHLKNPKPPKGAKGKKQTDNVQLIKDLCKKGWKKKIIKHKDPDGYKPDINRYKRQVNYELNSIIEMGLADYFLIVADLVGWAKKQGIRVGQARGSVAGCLVAHLLDITDIDPIKFDLLFERFLNPSRTGTGNIPDIDLDFQHDRREEVKQYIIEKYGQDHVAAIATFFQMGVRQAIKDVGRVFDKDFDTLNNMTRWIYNNETLDDVLENNMIIDLKIMAKEDPKFIECVKAIAGQKRHASIHAAGLILTSKPTQDYCPIFQQKGVTAAQWDMYDLVDRGLLKLDLLGLKNLTVIDMAEKLIGDDFRIEDISLEDPIVYHKFCEGETDGVFQFEQPHFKDLLRRIGPQSIIDLADINAIGRPGAKRTGQDQVYLNNREADREPEYPHECMREVLDGTYGALVYQEQVMALCHVVGGISLAETNDIRECIKHFDKKRMAKFGKRIRTYARKKHGIAKETCERIWQQIIAFSGYGFNKNHSVAYSLISYQTMWLKVYYPYEYMVSLLEVFGVTDTKLEQYLKVAIDMDLDIRDCHLLKSGIGFTLHKTKKGNKFIRLGFTTVKGIREKTAQKIIDQRKEYGKDVAEHITPGLWGKLEAGGVEGIYTKEE